MLSSAATSSIAAKTLTPVSTSTGTRVELRCPQPLRQVQWHPPQKVGGRELRGVTGYCPQLLCDVLADVDDPADCELFCGAIQLTRAKRRHVFADECGIEDSCQVTSGAGHHHGARSLSAESCQRPAHGDGFIVRMGVDGDDGACGSHLRLIPRSRASVAQAGIRG